jgi:hypothetical protein
MLRVKIHAALEMNLKSFVCILFIKKIEELNV